MEWESERVAQYRILNLSIFLCNRVGGECGFCPHTCFLAYLIWIQKKEKENKCNKIFLIIKLYSMVNCKRIACGFQNGKNENLKRETMRLFICAAGLS
jgi:hypothetical protein